MNINLFILIAVGLAAVMIISVLIATKVSQRRRHRALTERQKAYVRLSNIIDEAKQQAFDSGDDLNDILASKLTSEDRALAANLIKKAQKWLNTERRCRSQLQHDLGAAYEAWTSATSNEDRLEAGIGLHVVCASYRNSLYWDDRYQAQHDEMKAQLQGVMQSHYDELLADAPTNNEAFNSLAVLLSSNHQLALFHQKQYGQHRLPHFLMPIKPPANWRQLVGIHRENPTLGNYFDDILNAEKHKGQALLEAVKAIRDNDRTNARWLLAHCKYDVWQQEIGEMTRSQLAYVSISASADSTPAT